MSGQAEVGVRDGQDAPLVSVLMSVYNADEYLRPSVISILAQSYSNLELLIIDDGCSDGCMETIADLDDERIVMLRQENRGKAVALNLAMRVARGEFLAIQDGDDISHPHRIEAQVRCMLANPDLVAVFTGGDLILDGRRVAPSRPARGREECAALIDAMETPALDPTGMYRASLCKGMQFASELRVGQVCDFVLRLGELHPMLVLGERLYSYRFRWDSTTKSSPHLRRDCMQMVYRRSCERRGLLLVETPARKRVGSLSNRELDNNLASVFIDSVLDSRRRGEVALSFRTGISCIALNPLDPHYYKALVYAMLPPPALNLARLLSRLLGAHRRRTVVSMKETVVSR